MKVMKLIFSFSLAILLISSCNIDENQTTEFSVEEIANSQEYLEYKQTTSKHQNLIASKYYDLDKVDGFLKVNAKKDFCKTPDSNFSEKMIDEWIRNTCLIQESIKALNKKFNYVNLGDDIIMDISKFYSRTNLGVDSRKELENIILTDQ